MADDETALDLSVKTTTTTRQQQTTAIYSKRLNENEIITNCDQPPNKRKKTQPKPCKNLDIDDEYFSDDDETTSGTTIASIVANDIKQPIFDNEDEQQLINNIPAPTTTTSGKKQMRFQCKFCSYRSHSVSLMQNHIYRHIDTTPYSCFYCGHKSTTKSTIMVHIELCHPNMDVKIKENRVKEEDYYLDLNAAASNNRKSTPSTVTVLSNRFIDTCENKFQIIPSKCQTKDEKLFNEVNNEDGLNINSSPTTASSSSCCVSPAISPNLQQNEASADNNSANNDESKLIERERVY